MKKRLTALLACAFALTVPSQAETHTKFVPKEVWTDTDGNMINAHGGGVLYHKGTYYWYGEYKVGKTRLPKGVNWEAFRTEAGGVSCYSSRDLLNWKFEGVVLPSRPDEKGSDLHPSQVLERPKVIYNEKTKKFVMWLHVDSPNYAKASAGVAVCDSPTGQFEYLGSFRPNDSMSRDQTLFVDDDGRAYQFCSSEENQTMHINRLTDDYLKPDGHYVRRFVGMAREAPAVFKHDGKYYMISSGCTGWDPNQAELAVADSIMGEWTTIGNPCTGKDSFITFYGQSTCVIPTPKGYIACFDMWKKRNLPDSRYIWLPITIDKKTQTMAIPWMEEWTPSQLSK